jgi:hypothetical protein
MDDAAFVRGLDRGGDLTRHVAALGHRQRAAREPIGQCVAGNVFEDEQPLPLDFLDAIDRPDVGVIDGRESFASRSNRARLSGFCASAPE